MKLHFHDYHLEIRLYHTRDEALRAAAYPPGRRLRPERLRALKRRLRERVAAERQRQRSNDEGNREW